MNESLRGVARLRRTWPVRWLTARSRWGGGLDRRGLPAGSRRHAVLLDVSEVDAAEDRVAALIVHSGVPLLVLVLVGGGG